ncbi:MAG: regulator of cell morphogenesis and NO signaling [Parvicellaceae bacterium]|jgi:regulator of cell morphogenesis and NO signaling
MEITKEKTVAKYVAENIKTAHVFKKFGLDFCCGGNITLEQACINNNVDQAELEKQLMNVEVNTDRSLDFDSWKLSFLIDHIINVHHSYVKESLPLISQYSKKVVEAHSSQYPYLIEIDKLFHAVSDELMTHLSKEEEVLFPYIKGLESSLDSVAFNLTSSLDSVVNPIGVMEDEHENAGDVFKKIAKLTNNYKPPAGACNTFKALYSKLEEFEQDLHHHIHLENNILHPKAIALEENSKTADGSSVFPSFL